MFYISVYIWCIRPLIQPSKPSHEFFPSRTTRMRILLSPISGGNLFGASEVNRRRSQIHLKAIFKRKHGEKKKKKKTSAGVGQPSVTEGDGIRARRCRFTGPCPSVLTSPRLCPVSENSCVSADAAKRCRWRLKRRNKNGDSVSNTD